MLWIYFFVLPFFLLSLFFLPSFLPSFLNPFIWRLLYFCDTFLSFPLEGNGGCSIILKPPTWTTTSPTLNNKCGPCDLLRKSAQNSRHCPRQRPTPIHSARWLAISPSNPFWLAGKRESLHKSRANGQKGNICAFSTHLNESENVDVKVGKSVFALKGRTPWWDRAYVCVRVYVGVEVGGVKRGGEVIWSGENLNLSLRDGKKQE